MNTFASVGQRTNTIAAPARPAGVKKKVPAMMPMPAVSSMDMPNHAGQRGPVPMKGIVNSLVKRR